MTEADEGINLAQYAASDCFLLLSLFSIMGNLLAYTTMTGFSLAQKSTYLKIIFCSIFKVFCEECSEAMGAFLFLISFIPSSQFCQILIVQKALLCFFRGWKIYLVRVISLLRSALPQLGSNVQPFQRQFLQLLLFDLAIIFRVSSLGSSIIVFGRPKMAPRDSLLWLILGRCRYGLRCFEGRDYQVCHLGMIFFQRYIIARMGIKLCCYSWKESKSCLINVILSNSLNHSKELQIV